MSIANGIEDGAEHRLFDIRVLLSSSAGVGTGSGLSTVRQLALSSFTDLCQQRERALAEDDLKFDLRGEGSENREGLGLEADLSILISDCLFVYFSLC